MMVMEAVREIVKKCPYLDEYYKSLSVDRLGKDSTSYSIDSVPGQQVTKRDIAGNTTRQCLFNFSSRELYTEEVRQNLDNIGFYEHFSDWLEEVSEAGDFPELDAGKQSHAAMCLIRNLTRQSIRYSAGLFINRRLEDNGEYK